MSRRDPRGCCAVPIGDAQAFIPFQWKFWPGLHGVGIGPSSLLSVILAADCDGLEEARAALISELEDELGVDRAALAQAVTTNAAAIKRVAKTRKDEHRRAVDLRPVDAFGPSNADLKKLRNAEQGVADAQRLFAMGSISDAYDAMQKAKEDAQKAQADLAERKRKKWFYQALAESDKLERARGGLIEEKVLDEAEPGEERVQRKRAMPDAFKEMLRDDVLAYTGKMKENGKPFLDYALEDRRYKAGRRYKELSDAASVNLKSGLRFDVVGAASMDGAADARAHVLQELARLERAALQASGDIGLALIRIVVGQGRSIRSLEAPGSAYAGLKSAFLRALDAISAQAGGTARVQAVAFGEPRTEPCAYELANRT